jgi:hypothetical protein
VFLVFFYFSIFRWLVFPFFHVVKGDQTSKKSQLPKLRTLFTNLVALIYSIPRKREVMGR